MLEEESFLQEKDIITIFIICWTTIHTACEILGQNESDVSLEMAESRYCFLTLLHPLLFLIRPRVWGFCWSSSVLILNSKGCNPDLKVEKLKDMGLNVTELSASPELNLQFLILAFFFFCHLASFIILNPVQIPLPQKDFLAPFSLNLLTTLNHVTYPIICDLFVDFPIKLLGPQD